MGNIGSIVNMFTSGLHSAIVASTSAGAHADGKRRPGLARKLFEGRQHRPQIAAIVERHDADEVVAAASDSGFAEDRQAELLAAHEREAVHLDQFMARCGQVEAEPGDLSEVAEEAFAGIRM